LLSKRTKALLGSNFGRDTLTDWIGHGQFYMENMGLAIFCVQSKSFMPKKTWAVLPGDLGYYKDILCIFRSPLCSGSIVMSQIKGVSVSILKIIIILNRLKHEGYSEVASLLK
jgi:hypothetical protein